MANANFLSDLVSRIQQLFGQNQQPLLNPVVTPEDDYVASMKQKLGNSFNEGRARQIYREEMARRQKTAQSPRPQGNMWNAITSPQQANAATPAPTAMPQATPLGQILGYSVSIDPKTLPTYNNQKELERVRPYIQVIQKAAQQTGVPAQVLAAALWRESAGFNPKYITGRHTDGTGRGIAGIDAVQRKDVPDSVAYDPNQAIPWMANTLKSYQQAENGNTYNALRRYNGGPNYARQAIGFDKKSTIDQLTKKHADYIMANSQNLAPLFSPSPSATPAPLNNY